jgi:hypothetical protein
MHLLRASLLAALGFASVAALAACDADGLAPPASPGNPSTDNVAAAQAAQAARMAQQPQDDPDLTAAREQMRAASEAAATDPTSGAQAKSTPSSAPAPLPSASPSAPLPSAPSPSASPLAYLVTCDANYAGVYTTTAGPATVTQSACRVSVTYAHGTMTCAARGSSLDCIWQEGDSSGKATFQHAPDGGWSGASGSKASATERGPWTFSRSTS